MGLNFLWHLGLDASGKLMSLLNGGTRPHWLTVANRESRGRRSVPVSLYQVDGRSYVIDIRPSEGWSRDVRVPGPGTLTTGHADRRVTLTEVTDLAVKEQVVIAYAAEAERSEKVISFGDKDMQPPQSLLDRMDIGPKYDTPEQRAAAVPGAAVFEVVPA